MSSYDATLKIILLSESEVDKLGMFPDYLAEISKINDQNKIGVEILTKTLTIDKKNYKLQLWDLWLDKPFRFLLPTYCLGANAALLLYDVAKPQTLNNIGEWANIIHQKSGDIPIILIGFIPKEKSKRQVSAEEGMKIAKARNLNGYIEINARTGENIGKALKTITRMMVGKKRDFKVSEEKQFKSKKGIKLKVNEEFRIYGLENTGDRTKLNITAEELKYHLNPKKVLIIIRDDLRKIFIWKGAKSSVRKRFISARIAQDLQRDLIQDARYHRCKIVSITQGDELQEFLDAFRLESMEVAENLPDMRYPRNFERDKGDFKFIEEKLNNYIDTVERMMSVILKIPDLVDQSLATVNQKIATLESRINGTSNQKSAPPPPKPHGAPTIPPQGRESYPYPIISSPFPNWSRGARWIYCQKCGMNITKEKYFTHTCKIEPSGPRAQRPSSPVRLRRSKMGALRHLFSRRAQSEEKSRSESDSQLVSTNRPATTAGVNIDSKLKREVLSFLEWIKDNEGLSGYINYYLQQNNPTIISELSKIYSELRQIFGIYSPKTTSKPPLPPPSLHPPPPPKQPGDPVIAHQGKESYRGQIISLLSKIERFWELKNSRIIAVSLVQGSDTILYSTDNWDISADVGRLISSWRSLNAPFIMISGKKYSVLQCTSEILVATSIRGDDHILLAKDEDYTLILRVEPDGDDDSMVYPYIFTPPNPPDDFEIAPQSQLRAPLKEKDPEEEIYCQYCGKKLTTEEQITHSCKKKPE
ncbi:MAG: hypothetical protein KGD74_03690 [Candidatus Lokiarchaeota archaeon]|nr:hypothetical protein [Candidatus Lokiarchaeota archaeon]